MKQYLISYRDGLEIKSKVAKTFEEAKGICTILMNQSDDIVANVYEITQPVISYAKKGA
ncbi:hypothetical protein [Veillonella intestinalis]|uniref:hypothetical protein n=1 Tax=Veillonella intestinalis TaxID=2941341 RepID=UPI00203ADDFD|nr:hypothetical protein [Veillonella intestinalis]